MRTTLIRLITGINKKDFKGCIYYEGILEDALEEADEVL